MDVLKPLIDIAVPGIAFILLMAVGLNLTPADFARVRRAPAVVAAGVIVPLLVLPAIAVALIRLFEPGPFVAAGLLLVAACPIGGISNTYSYLAGASTALSVTLTGLSSLMAVVTIPVITRAYAGLLQEPLGAHAPVALIVLQLGFIVALPVGLGMSVRSRWPAAASAHSRAVQRVAFVLLGLLLLLIVASEITLVRTVLPHLVRLAVVFVVLSFAAGWACGAAVRAARDDRFTLAAEFATRNIAVATAIAVTTLGRTEFAVFASVYFLTELPLLLLAAAVWRRMRPG